MFNLRTGSVLALLFCIAIAITIPSTHAQSLPRLESDHPFIIPSGNWTTINDAAASGGSYRRASSGSLVITFTGSTFSVIYHSRPTFGTFAIEVDGVVLRTVNTAAPRAYNQHATIDYLTDGPHTLRLYTVTGTVAIDALELTPFSSPAIAPTPPYLATLNNPFPTASDFYGHSVAMSGDWAIVGAYQDDTPSSNSGTAYLYRRNGNDWRLVQALINPTPASSDRFGYAVDMAADLAIVGAYGDNTGGNDAGSAYVYQLVGDIWTLVATLNNPAPNANDRFGWSVGIGGGSAIVGAYQDDTGASNAGSAYIFGQTPSGWTLAATLNNPSPAGSDFFGYNVDILGSQAVVGASQDDTGRTNAGIAYLYEQIGGAWQAPITLNNPQPTGGDHFGRSVAIMPNHVLIGAHQDDAGRSNAGSAYLFRRSDAGWTLDHTFNNPVPAGNDRFGWAVAIEGDVAIISAYQDDTGASNAGAAYIFQQFAGDWTLVSTQANPSPAANDTFGYGVGISGGAAIIGARADDTGATDSGSAYMVGFVRIAPLPAASNLTTTILSATELHLAWQDNSTDEDSFRIERAENGGAFVTVGTVSANSTTFTDAGVACGTDFAYQVVTERGAVRVTSDPLATGTLCAPQFIANVGGTIPGRAGNCSRTNTRLQILMDDMLPATAYNIRYVFEDGGLPATYFHTRTLTATVLNPTAGLVLYPSVRDDYNVGISNAATMPNPIFLRFEMESATGGPSTCQRIEVQYSCSTGVATVISESNDCSAFPN